MIWCETGENFDIVVWCPEATVARGVQMTRGGRKKREIDKVKTAVVVRCDELSAEISSYRHHQETTGNCKRYEEHYKHYEREHEG